VECLKWRSACIASARLTLRIAKKGKTPKPHKLAYINHKLAYIIIVKRA
jgi:hypothetical protein